MCLESLPEAEDPTRFIWTHPEDFRITSIACQEDLSWLKWTVDYAEDLTFVRWLYGQLPEGFSWLEVLALGAEAPEEFRGRFPGRATIPALLERLRG